MLTYLDANATTKPAEAVVDAVTRALRERWHNPSSVHRPGQAARAGIEKARRRVASLIGAAPREIVFTAGGTESAHLAIRGVLAAAAGANTRERVRDTLVTTAGEHAAVRELIPTLERVGYRVRVAPIDGRGIVDPAAIEDLIDERTALVSVHWANSETGVIQPIADIRRVCAERGVAMHTDATQRVGKLPTSVSPGEPDTEDGVFAGEFLGFSAHKFHGPAGVGVLFARRGAVLSTVVPGAQELGRRGGTEAAASIEGAGVASDLAAGWLAEPANLAAGAELRDELERGLLAVWPGAVVNGDPARRLWNTTNIHFPGVEAEVLVLGLSERGVCVSAGSACSSGSLEPSPVLLAMGLGETRAGSSLRFSLARTTTRTEIEHALRVVREVRGSLVGGA